VNLSAYPEYRYSGTERLGDVPKHWEVKRGRFVMKVNPSAPRLRALKPNDEVSFVPMDAVGEYGGIRLDQIKQIDEIGSGYTEFQDGDVVVAKITPCFENGKGSLAQGLRNGVAYGTTELHVLRTLPNLDCRYLFYLTISTLYREAGEAEMYGAGGQKRVPPEFNKDFRTPLPLLDEQRTIADFLDAQTAKFDALLAKKRELIGALKEKRTALITRTVTCGLPPDVASAAGLDPHPVIKQSEIKWLGVVPDHWKVQKLSLHFIAKKGSNAALLTKEYCSTIEGNYPVYSGQTENDGVMSSINEYEFDAGSDGYLFSTTVGAKAMSVMHLKGKFSLSQNCMVIIPINKSIVPRFYYYHLQPLFTFERGLIPEHMQASFRMEDLYQYRIAIPSYSEQIEIADFLDRETAKIDCMVNKIEEAIERLQEYRSALITAAVTGKVDVRGGVT